MMAAAAIVLATSQAQAQRAWYASLAPEVPDATGSGYAFFSLTDKLLSVSATWSGLSGSTTMAHIHCCTAAPGTGTIGVAVGLAVPLGATSGSYDAVINLELASSFGANFLNSFGGGTVDGAQAALFNGFDTGKAYLNIHSTSFPGGEIRGFVTTVPEPTSMVLLSVGLIALAVPAVRRRGFRPSSSD